MSGKGSQKFLTKEYEYHRQRALEDRTRFTDDELTDLEITSSQGRGKTDNRRWEIWNNPYSPNQKIIPKRKYNIKHKPQIGDYD